MKNYVRVTLLIGGEARSYWAIRFPPLSKTIRKYLVVDRFGDEVTPRGPFSRHLIYADAADVVSEKTATLSLKYAELEENKS